MKNFPKAAESGTVREAEADPAPLKTKKQESVLVTFSSAPSLPILPVCTSAQTAGSRCSGSPPGMRSVAWFCWI
jgi:hypothetical protein